MLLKDFLEEAVCGLSRIYPAPEARNISLRLCEEIIGTKSYTHIVEPSFEIPSAKEGILREYLLRLEKGEPLQYVLGRAEFRDLTFSVGPGVLIPRPETEKIVEEVVALRPSAVLDLCTGSGCIAWSVALELPGARVVGVDISDAALKIAAGQDFWELLKERGAVAPEFKRADILDDIPDNVQVPFDVVVCNPPYVMDSEKARMRQNVLGYEPHPALFVPDEDPLVFYRAVACWAGKLLKSGGTGIVEINETLGSETASLFKDAGFDQVNIIKDIFEKERFVKFKKQ